MEKKLHSIKEKSISLIQVQHSFLKQVLHVRLLRSAELEVGIQLIDDLALTRILRGGGFPNHGIFVIAKSARVDTLENENYDYPLFVFVIARPLVNDFTSLVKQAEAI